MTAGATVMPPAMAALERCRAAWEKAGRPGPGSKQLVLEGTTTKTTTTSEGGHGR